MITVDWNIGDNIKCLQLTPDYLEETLNLIDTAFYPYENVSKVLQIADDPEAVKELRHLTSETAKDGVTVIAIDQTNNKVVGVALNKIQVKGNDSFGDCVKSWKNDKSRAIVQFMAEFDELCNLFEHCNIDCLLELMFLATAPEYRGKGIGEKLTELTIEIGKCLKNGLNVKKSLDGKQLELEPAPKIASAIMTTFISQRISQSIGMQTVAEKNCVALQAGGKSFAPLCKEGTTKMTLVYKAL